MKFGGLGRIDKISIPPLLIHFLHFPPLSATARVTAEPPEVRKASVRMHPKPVVRAVYRGHRKMPTQHSMNASSAVNASHESDETNETRTLKTLLQKGQNEQGVSEAPRHTRGRFFGKILSTVRHPLHSAMDAVVQTGTSMKGLR